MIIIFVGLFQDRKPNQQLQRRQIPFADPKDQWHVLQH